MSKHALHVLALSIQNGQCSTNNSYELAGIKYQLIICKICDHEKRPV